MQMVPRYWRKRIYFRGKLMRTRSFLLMLSGKGVVLNATGYFVAVKIVAQDVREAINAQIAASRKIFISLILRLILL